MAAMVFFSFSVKVVEVSLLVLLPVAALFAGRLVRRGIPQQRNAHGWDWTLMRGTSPLPSPRWHNGVFLQRRTHTRAPALCVRVHVATTPTDALNALVDVRCDALTWYEPELFCIDALFATSFQNTMLAHGGTRMYLRLTPIDGQALTPPAQNPITRIDAVFIPSKTKMGDHRQGLDTLHAPLHTWIFTEYAKRGYNEAQMLDVERMYRTAASWLAEVVTAVGASGLADAVTGANLADLVSRRG
jgi:hypothetical protein